MKGNRNFAFSNENTPLQQLIMLTTQTLMGGSYIVKKNVTEHPAIPSSALLTLIHFIFLFFLSDLDYVLSAGTYQTSEI